MKYSDTKYSIPGLKKKKNQPKKPSTPFIQGRDGKQEEEAVSTNSAQTTNAASLCSLFPPCLRSVGLHTHWLLTGTMGELEKRSVAPPLLLALPTDWVLGDTVGV